jgi:hypothetical protein
MKIRGEEGLPRSDHIRVGDFVSSLEVFSATGVHWGTVVVLCIVVSLWACEGLVLLAVVFVATCCSCLRLRESMCSNIDKIPIFHVMPSSSSLSLDRSFLSTSR